MPYGNRPSKNLRGGERGIRTLDTLLRCTHFPGALLKPLGHLSILCRRVSVWREIGRKIRIIFGFRPPCVVFIFSEFQNRHFTTTNPPSWRKSCNSRGRQVSLNTTNNYERRKMRYQAFGLRHQRRKQRRQLLHHQTPRREKARLWLWYQKVAKKAGDLCRPSFLRKVDANRLVCDKSWQDGLDRPLSRVATAPLIEWGSFLLIIHGLGVFIKYSP